MQKDIPREKDILSNTDEKLALINGKPNSTQKLLKTIKNNEYTIF